MADSQMSQGGQGSSFDEGGPVANLAGTVAETAVEGDTDTGPRQLLEVEGVVDAAGMGGACAPTAVEGDTDTGTGQSFETEGAVDAAGLGGACEPVHGCRLPGDSRPRELWHDLERDV